MMKKIFFFLLMLLSVSLTQAQEVQTFSTWETLGADACASAWLIKRFVNKNAEFKFYPKGELIEDGIPFDTPDAEIQRKANMSAYEVVLKKYKIVDKRAVAIGKIIHEIELNAWAAELTGDAAIFDSIVKKILSMKITPQEKIIQVFTAIDDFYELLRIK